MTLLLISVLGLAAATLAATIGVFLSLRRQAWADQQARAEAICEQSDEIAKLHAAFAALEQRYAELEQRSALLVPPPPLRSGLNLSVRTHALRLLGKGDDVQRVAAALGIPRDEVRLLSSLRTLMMTGSSATTAEVDRAAPGRERQQRSSAVQSTS
jgi:hypothetical protein